MKKHGGQVTHGKSGSREYRVWADMRQRCLNPKNARYQDYGGRGIKICDRWNEFASFFADMGERPSKAHSMDRRDNNGDYTPNNCRWATRSEQQNNKKAYPTDNAIPKGDDHWTRKHPRKARALARKNISLAHRRGEGNGRARLTELDVKSIKAKIKCGISDAEIAEAFKVRPGTIWFIRTGRNWGHVQ